MDSLYMVWRVYVEEDVMKATYPTTGAVVMVRDEFGVLHRRRVILSRFAKKVCGYFVVDSPVPSLWTENGIVHHIDDLA